MGTLRSRHTGAAPETQRYVSRAARLGFEVLEPRLVFSGTGLTAQYFHNADFTGLAETRSEAIAHRWGIDSPGAGIASDSFSVRWTGQIEPEFSETYTFTTLSDEGVRVWVDGQLIIDDWSAHFRRFDSGTIALVAGHRYDIRVDYYEGSGAAQIELSWSSPSRPLQIVPSSRLYASPAGLLGSYSDGTGNALTRVDPAVHFDWGTGSPHPSLADDGVGIEWTGQVRPDFSEEYTFELNSDDRVRLWIAGELVIDNWTDSPGTAVTGKKHLEAGKWHDVRIEYFDESGVAGIEWRWSSEQQTSRDFYEVVPTESLRAAKPSPIVFANPLGAGADPFVIRWEDQYAMVRSQGNGVWLDRSDAIQTIHASHPASDSVAAWSAPAGTHYSKQVWAPELHRFGNSWFIYVAASDGNNATHRMHVLERNDPDPFGPYVYKAQLAATTDRWAIDGTVLEWQDQLYFVWSGWPGFTNGQQNLYIAEMRNPWTIRGERVLLASPQFAWEKHGLSINEGPQVLMQEGTLHIVYSASGYWTRQYALGRLTYNGTGSLLDPASWTKAPQPVFQATSQVVGVGHASFTKSPDGTEDWIVYHTHANPTQFNENRVVSIQPFTFDVDGTPNFGSPLAPGQMIPAPSVGPQPERLYVTGDYNADGIVDELDYSVWKATFGAQVFPASGADGNGDGRIDAADYSVWRDNRVDQGVSNSNDQGAQSTAIDELGLRDDTSLRVERDTRQDELEHLYNFWAQYRFPTLKTVALRRSAGAYKFAPETIDAAMRDADSLLEIVADIATDSNRETEAPHSRRGLIEFPMSIADDDPKLLQAIESGLGEKDSALK